MNPALTWNTGTYSSRGGVELDLRAGTYSSKSQYTTGDKALDATLAALGGKIAAKAMKSGLRSSVAVIAKAIKSDMPKGLRKTIGSKFKDFARGKIIAKAGAAVAKPQTESKRRNRPGVGISANNIHWWMLGTKVRHTKKGVNRGAMPAFGTLPISYAKSRQSALDKFKLQVARTIERESIKEAARNRTKG